MDVLAGVQDLIGQPTGQDGSDGWKCVSLVVEAYRRAGVTIPYSGEKPRSPDVKAAGTLVDEPAPGDVVIFSGQDQHEDRQNTMGLFVRDGVMLTATGKTVGEYDFGRSNWCQARFLGYWRIEP